jgi:hypothetical protein
MYVDLEDLKKTLSLQGLSYADLDIETSIAAASEAVESVCNRTFELGEESNDDVRLFTPYRGDAVEIDDCSVITEVAVDRSGIGDYSEVWVLSTDYRPIPLNAASKGRPWTELQTPTRATRRFPMELGGVQVTGRFGWIEVPAPVLSAVTILAVKLVRRVREAPFGIVTVGIDAGASARIARHDPDVMMLVTPYIRSTLLA